MQPLDFSPIANAPLQAMQAAAYGDAMQANRLQNRLASMAVAEDQRKKSVAGMVAESLYGARRSATTPGGSHTGHGDNESDGSGTGQPAQAAPQLPPAAATPGTEIMSQMAQAPVNRLAPAAPAPDTPAPTNPFTQQRVRLRDLYNSGQITAQEAQAYDEQITAAEHTAREQKAKETLDGINLQIKQGTLAEDKQKLLMGKLEPLVRAMTPVQEEYERLIAAKTPPDQAIAAVQPMYQRVVKTLSAMPGFEEAAKSAAPDFNPAMAYLVKDTYAAIERRALAGDNAAAKSAAAAEKANERTTTQYITPAGLPVSADKQGRYYVNGKPYTGKVTKDRAPVSLNADAGSSKLPPVNVPLESSLESLAQKMAKGELMPSQLPKRRGTYEVVLARALAINPNFNPRTEDANYALAKNSTFRNRALTAEVLPEVMGEMVKAGKKVNYSDTQFVGKLQQFAKGQMNDPNFVEYMVVRNDALMTIAAVMRGNGMTDMAHQAEVEASNPTMSPRALDAWVKGQTTSLNPRLKLNKDIIKGSGGGDERPAPRIGQAAKWITSDMRGKWSDAGRQEAVYRNLKGRGYSDAEIGQAFKQAKGL